MTRDHSNAGFVDLEPVFFGKGLSDVLRNVEIDAQVVRRGTLCHLDQPTCISHEHRLVGRLDCPELVEHILNERQPIAGAARSGIPQAHAQELEAADHIQVEQRVRVMDSTTATRPARLLPEMKSADHQLRWIDQAVMQAGKHTRLESTRPMRAFQLASKTRLALRNPSACEETILDMTRQHGTVSEIFNRLPLGVQHALQAFDDLVAMGQEELKQFDMCLKRHVGGTRSELATHNVLIRFSQFNV